MRASSNCSFHWLISARRRWRCPLGAGSSWSRRSGSCRWRWDNCHLFQAYVVCECWSSSAGQVWCRWLFSGWCQSLHLHHLLLHVCTCLGSCSLFCTFLWFHLLHLGHSLRLHSDPNTTFPIYLLSFQTSWFPFQSSFEDHCDSSAWIHLLIL